MPLCINEALALGVRELQGPGNPCPALDAALLLAHVTGLRREALLLRQETPLSPEALETYHYMLERRRHFEPMAYILGEKEFWSLDFFVTSATLIPRPDSETLIETVLCALPDKAAPLTLLDMGTGTGCLPVALLRELPAASGVAVDNNKDALRVARRNIARHDLSSRLRLVCSDWGNALDGTFDLILANPPYIAEDAMAQLMPDVAHFEPAYALAGGQDGLDAYRALVPDMKRLIAPGGLVALEIGHDQAEDVTALLLAQGFGDCRVTRDLSGHSRCVTARFS